MLNDSVVVSGLGPVSSIGIGRDAFRRGIEEGRVGTGPIRSFDTTGFPYVNAGEVVDFDPRAILTALDESEWGRSSLLAASAARLAFEDAGGPAELDPERCSSVIGTTSGESQEIEALVAAWVDDPQAPMDSADASRVAPSSLADAVNAELGFGGEAMTVSTACSASNYAVGYAYDLLMSGEADAVIAGGADAVCRWAHAGFYRLGAMTQDVCSPFDEHRSGILTAEGGAALFLERRSQAVARGARIYATVRGYALSCDASHMVSPNREGIVRCMRLALENSGTRAEDVDYICAHGTGTAANDLTEGMAVKTVFGDDPPPISSIKSMLGHSMGAASGFGAIASVLALHEGFLPPTVNHRQTDHRLTGLDVVPNTSRPAHIGVAQNNGFAFGGNNAIVIFGKEDRA